MVHRHAADRARERVRPRSRAGGVGRRARRDRADRRDRRATTASTCDFAWVPGYLHAPLGRRDGTDADGCAPRGGGARRRARLRRDVRRRVPFVGGPGVRFDNQARFHPRKYLAALAHAIVARGGTIYEHSAADEFCDGRARSRRTATRSRATTIVLATHTPLVGNAGHRRARRCFRPSSRSTRATSSPAACRKGACPTRSSGTRPIRTTTCASSRSATTTS